ncbi:MAG: DNA translocase FtsK 4TM domain-containing protein [Peptococcaceae bacterium]|nr:DNA translocase FtsK 4TM domain-containing protein [Peptococcaceae bacterium]
MGYYGQIKREVRYEIFGLLLTAMAVLAFLSLLSAEVGTVGNVVAKLCRAAAGEGAFLLPVAVGYWGLKLIKERDPAKFPGKIYGGLICLVVILTVLHLYCLELGGLTINDLTFSKTVAYGLSGDGGGVVGAFLSWVIFKAFGYAGGLIILTSAGLVGLVLFTELSVVNLVQGVIGRIRRAVSATIGFLGNFLFVEVETREKPSKPVIIDYENDKDREKDEVPAEESPALQPVAAEIKNDKAPSRQMSLNDVSSYVFPPLNLLTRPKIKGQRPSKNINDKVRILEDTLESFGIKAKVLQVSRGPAITRYEVQPAAGVKVSRIVSLADDIALTMAAPGVRIEAPIPGKAAVGIEVPNSEVTMVPLRDLIESKEFTQSPSRLTVALGKDIAGKPVIGDLAMMPHLLIAGATGAGKSVCLNTLITSILFKSSPEEVKFLLIDPKMVELTTYNGIPHLISPVVTDAKKAAVSLKWLVREMERRYELFAASGVRDITRYNSIFKVHDKTNEQMRLPLIVVVIDELADLMIVAPHDVEDAICRLAQMARAAGIHLVVATQRPSVDVITGLIKANIPSRISFAVSSQTDSRTILDIGGAEKLLGKGDMLFLPVGAAKPIRVQGAYVSDKDVENVVGFLKKQAAPEYQDEEIFDDLGEDDDSGDFQDELLPKAVETVVLAGHASISLLQRRLHIGYARAARLIDIMEKMGYVGGYEGSKPRQVLISKEQFQQIFKQK